MFDWRIYQKEQYRQKKESYEKEIAELNYSLTQNNKEKYNSYDSEQIIADVKEYLSDLLYARKQDDIFYKTIIEKIVVYDRKHFDVYLNLLPHRWKVVLNSALEPNDLCGSIKHTTYRFLSYFCSYPILHTQLVHLKDSR